MPLPPDYLARNIKNILQHVQPLPDEAKSPILHYKRTNQDLLATLSYLERSTSQGKRDPTAVERHLNRIYGMALIYLVESFERFLKEIAAECIDSLSEYVVDDRFNVFTIKGSTLAAHFETDGTLGKSLCESSTWLDCEEINLRFRKLLSDPFQSGGQWFELFPKQPPADYWRFETMNLIWQIRHTAVHNVGAITRSDAVRLRLWSKENVEAPRMLSPTRGDINYLKRFLDETATLCNQRIGERLAELAAKIYIPTPAVPTSQVMADRLASIFRLPLKVGLSVGVIPPD